MNPQHTQTIDPDVKNLVSAMGQVETGTSSSEAYTKRGASGEYGRYQFMPNTWDMWAKEAGVTSPLEQSTIEDQNKVAYHKVKQFKDQGLNPAQIASLWNSGNPDAYKQQHAGTNSQGVQYDTPEHVRKVSEAYQRIKGGSALGGTYQPPTQAQQFTPATTTGFETLQQQTGAKQGGLVSDVGESLAGVGQGLDKAYMNTATGGINIGSGILQGVGSIAGGAGSVIDDALSNIPVVGGVYEKATEKVGQALGGAAQATGLSDWYRNQSEETQGNLGAVMDIASIVPLFKALKYGKTGISDFKTTATLGNVEKNAAKELEASLNKPQRRVLDRANSRGLDPMGAIVKNQDYLPDVIEKNGKFYFDTKEAAKNIQRDIDVDEKALQNLLESTRSMDPNQKGLAFNINDIASQTVADVMSKAGRTGNFGALKTSLTKYFDDYKQSMQGVEFVDLPELNSIKRDIRSAINFDAVDPTGTLAKQAKFDAGQSLMKQVEDAAKKAGLKGVKELNDAMGTKLTALDIIEHLGDGKIIKSGPPGLIKSISKETPILSGLVDYATRRAPLTPTTRLKSRRPLRETGRKGLVQLGAGLGLSGQIQSEQPQ